MNKTNTITFGEVIAERELVYDTKKGSQTLIIKLGKPRPDLKPGGDWECPIQVGNKVTLVFGVDSFQALSLAQQFISIQLRYLKDKENLNLKWLDMADLGFEPIRE